MENLNQGLLKSRIISALIDFAISLPIAFVAFYPLLSFYNSSPIISHFPDELIRYPILPWSTWIGLALLVSKDLLKGYSIGKQVMRLEIVSNKKKIPPNYLQLILRNCTLILFPIEILLSFISPRKRLGDFISATSIQEKSFASKQTSIGKTLGVLATLFFIFLFTGKIYSKLIENNSPTLHPIEASYNQELSLKVESLFEGSYNELLTADVKIYDSIPGIEQTKYISIHLHMHYDVVSNNEDFGLLKAKTFPIIERNLPFVNMIGQIQYIYQSQNQTLIKATPINKKAVFIQ